MKKVRSTLIAFLLLMVAVGIVYLRYPPNPKQCALCGHDEIYHAPVLINLETGEIGELKVYRAHPFIPGEISEIQDTGSYSILRVCGAEGIADWGHSAQVTLPKELPKMKKSLFCRNCRALLSASEIDGYVLLDLHDRNDIHTYQLFDGAEYKVRDYLVSVIRTGPNYRQTICVTGINIEQ